MSYHILIAATTTRLYVTDDMAEARRFVERFNADELESGHPYPGEARIVPLLPAIETATEWLDTHARINAQVSITEAHIAEKGENS